MDKYEALRVYKAARIAEKAASLASQQADRVLREAREAEDAARKVLNNLMKVDETIVFEGEAWVRDDYGRFRVLKLA